MRHRKRSKKLSRLAGHRQATLRNLVIALFRHQRIKTTKPKAQLAQSLAERLISLAKKDSLHSRRHAFSILNDRTTVGELFSTIAPLFKAKSSGFTRRIRYKQRDGDGAELVFLELTEKSSKVKPAKPEQGKKKLEKPEPEEKPKEKPGPAQEKKKPKKELKPKKFLGGLRGLFKKERDSL
ncbi:MAG: 50S ribosomal protein L17 [Candidatus Omnitrophica bacterium]|nr:50S ribosomal protein L17 [Candidatus Omnitrophota bacterium]